MTATIQILLLFLTVLVAAALIARRLNTAPSIVLVIAGVALALTPGLPAIELAPEFVLLVILPPLIYSAGVSMSWREFRFNLRPITLLAFGCVVFTAGAVAVAAHYVLGFSWAVGFLLGAIVAPPDVVAPLAIARRLGLPRRRRLGRAGHRRHRALCELERAAADPLGDAAAGHLLLGPDHLPDRGFCVPAHRLAGAHLIRAGRTLRVARHRGGDASDHGDRHRCA